MPHSMDFLEPSLKRGGWLLGAMFTALACAPPPAPPPVIGAALSTTFLNAVRLGFDDAMSTEGMPPTDTMLVPEGTSRSGPALDLAEAFADAPGMMAVIGHSNSSASLATSPIYNTAGIVQIAPTATAMRYTEAGQFSFRLVPPDSSQGTFLAKAIDSLFLPGARVAVMYVNDDYGRGLRSALVARLADMDHPVVFDQPHSDEELALPDSVRESLISATVQAVVAARPTVIVWLGRPSILQLYILAIRRMGGSLPVLGGDAISSWADLADRGSEWEGVQYVDFFTIDGSPELRAFRDRYLTRFGVPPGSAEVLSYDAVRLLLAARAEGATKGEEVRLWLLSLGRERPAYRGLSGPIAFSPNGDVERGYVLVTIPSGP
ncbi:MAG: branched-chain amino acid ABC transporter substrate-binding protein [Gemmatimonadales bacterium]|nr:branched-chain amino acid ABC transporter substrate-binding protein [Gemmatimonadales bacterium]